jgi:hypothetical protein
MNPLEYYHQSWFKLIKEQRDTNCLIYGDTISFAPISLVQEIVSNGSILSEHNIAILFTVEWAIYLKLKGYNNISVFTNGFCKYTKRICDMWNIKYYDNMDVKMKFDVVIGNPPYNSSSGGPHGTGGNNRLYRTFVEFALTICQGTVALVTPKGVLKHMDSLKITPLYVNLMSNKIWKYDTCYFIVNTQLQSTNIITKIDAPDSIMVKMFSRNDTFNLKLVDGKSNPIPKRLANTNKIRGIIDHMSAALPTFKYGQIVSSVADYGPKLISNLYGRKASWAVTDEPSCVPGFTFMFDSIDNANKFYLFLSHNKALEYFRITMNETKGVVKVCRYLKKFDLSQIITGYEYPVEYGLTQEEIDYIEATVK